MNIKGANKLSIPVKKGFTLAEVLITLGIIGVVAAMTIPSLINATEGKELEAAFKKAYSVLTQAVLIMEREEGQTVNWDNYPSRKFAPVFKKYVRDFFNCGTNGCLTADIEDEDNPVFNRVSSYRTYDLTQNVTMEWFDEGQAILGDGMFLMIQNSNVRENGIVLSIDVNGISKRPNAWGHDLFSFQITHQGKLIPMGSPESSSNWGGWGGIMCDKDTPSRQNGIGCAYRALTEKDYFKNLPR